MYIHTRHRPALPITRGTAGGAAAKGDGTFAAATFGSMGYLIWTPCSRASGCCVWCVARCALLKTSRILICKTFGLRTAAGNQPARPHPHLGVAAGSCAVRRGGAQLGAGGRVSRLALFA